MHRNLELVRTAPAVVASLNYLAPSASKPVSYTVEPPVGVPRFSGTLDSRDVPIRDARSFAGDVSLDVHGFALVPHRSAVRDFYDEGEVRSVYYAEAEQLLTRQLGAAKVIVFDHTVRRRPAERPPLTSGRPNTSGPREPVGRVHNDFTALSAPQRVRLELGERADALLKCRFAVINVWRPLRGPLLDAPLAVCDAGSLTPDDLVASDLVYPDRTGEIYSVVYNAEHRWFYYSRMNVDEALLIKCYDSAEDGRARFAPHSAFEDPTTPADAAPRESIELRTFVFYPE